MHAFADYLSTDLYNGFSVKGGNSEFSVCILNVYISTRVFYGCVQCCCSYSTEFHDDSLVRL